MEIGVTNRQSKPAGCFAQSPRVRMASVPCDTVRAATFGVRRRALRLLEAPMGKYDLMGDNHLMVSNDLMASNDLMVSNDLSEVPMT